MPELIERLRELVGDASRLLSDTCLGGAHKLPDLIAPGNLRVDVSQRDDHALAYCQYFSTVSRSRTWASSGSAPASRSALRWRSRSQQRSSSTDTSSSRRLSSPSASSRTASPSSRR